MKIVIDYESSWRNSFLDGSNNEQLPRTGRKYIAASSNLNDRKKPESFKKINVSNNTICGLLSRLIGDQRKLYQARASENYYFKDLERHISFIDHPRKSISWNELVYLRNMTGSFDRESYVGPINTNHWVLNSRFSNELWSVVFLDLKQLIGFLCGETINSGYLDLDPRCIIDRVSDFSLFPMKNLEDVSIEESQVYQAIQYLREISVNLKLKQLFPTMKKSFEDIEYIKNEKLDVRALYCSSVYFALLKLDAKGEKIPSNIKGLSVAGLTSKDFMSLFTKGKKKVYGNPYLKKEKIKGQGEVVSMLTKASGQLEITIDVDKKKGREIAELIENAGVSSFYLGKKGLAYVSKIRP